MICRCSKVSSGISRFAFNGSALRHADVMIHVVAKATAAAAVAAAHRHAGRVQLHDDDGQNAVARHLRSATICRRWHLGHRIPSAARLRGLALRTSDSLSCTWLESIWRRGLRCNLWHRLSPNDGSLAAARRHPSELSLAHKSLSVFQEQRSRAH